MTEYPLVDPREVLRQVAGALPGDLRKKVIVVGSLAAGYHYFADSEREQVRTKDVDCLLSPHIRAVATGQRIAERLFQAGWMLRTEGDWNRPGGPDTPDDQLPLIRLRPAQESPWFIELLGAPAPGQRGERKFRRLVTSHGHFSICSFGYLGLVEYDPEMTEFGLRIAHPEMMALANLLHHPQIRADTMSGLIRERRIKRSNKDLGRVLAIAYLAERENENALRNWPERCLQALKATFPERWRKLARTADSGLVQLLRPEHHEDLEQAHHTCVNGLLAGLNPDLEELRITGERLLQDVFRPLAEQADTR